MDCKIITIEEEENFGGMPGLLSMLYNSIKIR
jgi:hypothetical protein